MNQTVTAHSVFREAIADIESLGVRVTDYAVTGAIPYTIVGGRSNARWWLIPLQNRHVTASGLALFQPILTSARLMKWAAATLSKCGLGGIWAKPKLYISGTPSIGKFCGNRTLSYAYFTGTESPHRKVAVQVMDMDGRLIGFAKVSRNPLVRPLLQHEAATLSRIGALGLDSAVVPNVLFCGEENGASLLVTDTLKTPHTKTTTALLPIHAVFLRELADKTVAPSQAQAVPYVRPFADRLAKIQGRVSTEWQKRLQFAIDHVGAVPESHLLPATQIHGDFTPWNTFIVDKKLYVFDWEYADAQAPASNDLIHFMRAQPRAKRQTAAVQLASIKRALKKTYGIARDDVAASHLLIYLTSHTLRYIERCTPQPGMIVTWDGAHENAALIDAVLHAP